MLPAEVVAALCRVRDAEHQTEQWKHWCLYLDTQETPQKLPPAQESVASLPVPDSKNMIVGNHQNQDDHISLWEDGLFPTVESLYQEAQQQMDAGRFESIVFGGEGESTLRLAALASLAAKLAKNNPQSSLPLRLTTNGVMSQSVTTKTAGSDSQMDNKDDNNIPKLLRTSGITSVSVALMTHDPLQYDSIMLPNLILSSNDGKDKNTAHKMVCQFIKNAVQAGLQVETTGVARPDVNQQKTEDLAKLLGVEKPFRWRTYFP